ncbi:MAG: hypothetical protein AAF617_09615 [Bacteroidota bacterium]
MSLPISYQIVGTYGFFPFGVLSSPLNTALPNLNIMTSSIDQILDAVEARVNSFPPNPNSLQITTVNNNTARVSYKFDPNSSLKPVNALMPSAGIRTVRTRNYTPENSSAPTFTGVIQYYRSVTVYAKNDPNKTKFTINLRSQGQPDVVNTTFFQQLADFNSPVEVLGFLLPYEVVSYNIIQRTVLIELKGRLLNNYTKVSNLLDKKSDEISTAFDKGETRMRYHIDFDKDEDEDKK